MKLRNKKTGEIGTYLYSNPQHIGLGNYSVQLDRNPMTTIQYEHNFDKLYQDWEFLGEDYEEPTTYYYISDFGAIREGDVGKFVEDEIARKEIGNYFETKKEAEKAVEKLKAWKRLKDKWFKFQFWSSEYSGDKISFFVDWINAASKKEIEEDLDLLFGGEND